MSDTLQTTRPRERIGPREKIGLVAAWGRYPLVVARELRRQGYAVYCLGIKDHADPALREVCDDYFESNVARLGTHIAYFRKRGVRRAVMAGKLHKTILFRRFYWIRNLPDWRCVRTFYPHFITRTKNRNDDAMLTAVVEAYAEDGIEFAPATDYVPELLVPYGNLSRRRPTRAQRQDVAFAWRLAKEIGRLDVGQCVAVHGRAVLAVEAVEGTDECIRRAGRLCPQGGFTVVKVAKPQQDMRFDVPTIGIGTLEALVEAGGSVLAVEAHKTIIIDAEEVARFADRHGLVLVAVEEGRLGELSEAA